MSEFKGKKKQTTKHFDKRTSAFFCNKYLYS